MIPMESSRDLLIKGSAGRGWGHGRRWPSRTRPCSLATSSRRRLGRRASRSRASSRGPRPEDCGFQLVAEQRTSMADCLRQMNKNSFGLAAEAFFKTLGALANPDGKGGSWAGGQSAVAAYLMGLGIDDTEFVIADGSGLSRENRLTAGVLTRVLTHLSGQPDWEFYRGSLAVGGVDGTIENRSWEPMYRGRVMAKSGYISTVRSLSGIARTSSGEFVFSFLANTAGGGARTAIDNAVKALVDWGDGRPPAVPKPKARTARRTAKR